MNIKIITSIAIEKNGRFLILKRSPRETFPRMWEFSGGKINVGEKMIDSVKREMREETGLVPNKLEYKGYTERFTEETDEDSGHVIVHHFYCNDFKGKIKLSKEHTDLRWVTKEEILNMKVNEEVGSDTVDFFYLNKSNINLL